MRAVLRCWRSRSANSESTTPRLAICLHVPGGFPEIMVEAIRAHHSYDVLDLKTLPGSLTGERPVAIGTTFAEHVTRSAPANA